MYKFKKIAGLILDQQDDPGAGWELISQFWPDDLVPPNYGTDIEKTACAVSLTDGISKVARYPVDTPSNALASSMYFLAFGAEAIEDQSDVLKIAADLQEYRIAHSVSLPKDFIDFLKHAEAEEVEEIYADDDKNLPVTTQAQAEASISLFTKKANLWSASERMLFSAKLEKVAEHYGIEATLPFASKDLSKHAGGAIDLRLALIDEVTRGIDDIEYQDYIEGMENIKVAMQSTGSYEEILKMASDIESLDKEFGMDEAWGVQIPNPVDTLLEGFNTDPFSSALDKAAEVDWDAVDWSGLPFEDGVIEAIQADPEVIVPTLPTAQRKIVEDHIYGK